MTKVLIDGATNPKFKFWKKQDGTLGCWLMRCMSDEILKQIYGFDTSREYWVKIEEFFASKFRAKMIQLKNNC